MLILLAETSSESGLWPVLPQRMVSLSVAVVVARLTGPRDGTTVRWWQVVGLIGTIVGVSLILFG